jgi:DTW domain-containing protein YfiP
MNINTYRENRERQLQAESRVRSLCLNCFQPEFGCYCSAIRAFDPNVKFVILIHPIEVRRRIATGRMAHLCLENSHLVMGQDYSNNKEVNSIISDPRFYSVVLYPGVTSVNLTTLSKEGRGELFPNEKSLAIFVIDGTWATARKMIRSQNLKDLPRICFEPKTPSRFRVRKQPAPGCYSTIEAIHHTIDLLGCCSGGLEGEGQARPHDALLDVFDLMVERQLACIKTIKTSRQAASSSYRREK